MNTVSQEQILELIEAGIQAPSADNGQPWKFKLLEDGFELSLDQARMGLFFDAKQVATHLSCGAVAENVVLLANAFGFSSDITYTPNSNTRFAKFTFAAKGNAVDVEGVRKTIVNRHTNRNFFQFGKKIPDTLMAQLSSLFYADDNYQFHSYQDPMARKKSLKLLWQLTYFVLSTNGLIAIFMKYCDLEIEQSKLEMDWMRPRWA